MMAVLSKCPDCKGKGTMPDGKTCTDCGGSGMKIKPGT